VLADRTVGAVGANSGETNAHTRGDQHGIRPPQPGRRRLRLAVAGAAVVTALTTATAAAVVPSVQTSASQTTRPDRGSGGTGPRSEFPGFLLDRGRYRTIAAPDPGVELFPLGVNNRGQVVGFAPIVEATQGTPTTPAPMGRMA
jgi:hypothetical protein